MSSRWLAIGMWFFFKKKTACEIKECVWSSDVCSSDLLSQKYSRSLWTMQPMRRPSLRMARSIESPSPSTQKRKLFSKSALGITGMHDCIISTPPTTESITPRSTSGSEILDLWQISETVNDKTAIAFPETIQLVLVLLVFWFWSNKENKEVAFQLRTVRFLNAPTDQLTIYHVVRQRLSLLS